MQAFRLAFDITIQDHLMTPWKICSRRDVGSQQQQQQQQQQPKARCSIQNHNSISCENALSSPHHTITASYHPTIISSYRTYSSVEHIRGALAMRAGNARPDQSHTSKRMSNALTRIVSRAFATSWLLKGDTVVRMNVAIIGAIRIRSNVPDAPTANTTKGIPRAPTATATPRKVRRQRMLMKLMIASHSRSPHRLRL